MRLVHKTGFFVLRDDAGVTRSPCQRIKDSFGGNATICLNDDFARRLESYGSWLLA